MSQVFESEVSDYDFLLHCATQAALQSQTGLHCASVGHRCREMATTEKKKKPSRYLIEAALRRPVNDREVAQEEDGLRRQSTSHLSV